MTYHVTMKLPEPNRHNKNIKSSILYYIILYIFNLVLFILDFLLKIQLSKFIILIIINIYI